MTALKISRLFVASNLLMRSSCCMQLKRFQSDSKIMSVVEVREKLKKIVSAPTAWQAIDRSSEVDLVPSSQDDLAPREMADSFSEAIIKLSDPLIREKYISAYNTVRIGRLLEDLDTLGVLICYKHNMTDPAQKTSPLTIVTALVDRLEMHADIVNIDWDMKIAGKVTWVGKSSLEVSMTIYQICPEGTQEHVISATFVNVARDPTNQKAVVVHPLKACSPEEESILQRGEQRKLLRQQECRDSLLKSAPSADERELVHDMFLNTLQPGIASFSVRKLPPNTVWMEDTKVKNAILCFPQQRNIHNKIFGGFLMRKATETAYTNALLFCHCRVHIVAVDDIQFRKPVDVGSVIFISSEIAYVEGKHMLIRVHTEVEDIVTGHRDTTNVFHYTIVAENMLPKVIPKTYGESMLYLDGRRHYLSFKNETF